MKKVNYQTFIEMLKELNQFIVEQYNPTYILEVRAIGGFSMIIHRKLGNVDNPREKSYDIDSLTKDYPEEIVSEIKKIGAKHGADDADGWLNNHWNKTKNYNEEFEYFIKWKELKEVSLSNIKIYYADLESLFMFKLRAIDDRIVLAGAEPRQQDVIDVVSILKAFEVENLDNVSNTAICNTISYFPSAINYLIDNDIFKGTKF